MAGEPQWYCAVPAVAAGSRLLLLHDRSAAPARARRRAASAWLGCGVVCASHRLWWIIASARLMNCSMYAIGNFSCRVSEPSPRSVAGEIRHRHGRRLSIRRRERGILRAIWAISSSSVAKTAAALRRRHGSSGHSVCMRGNFSARGSLFVAMAFLAPDVLCPTTYYGLLVYRRYRI